MPIALLSLCLLVPQFPGEKPDPYAASWRAAPARPFVTVTTPEPWHPPSTWPLHAERRGVLLADDGVIFRVHVLGDGERTFRWTRDGRGTRVGHAPAAVPDLARATLAALRQGTAPPAPLPATLPDDLWRLAIACRQAKEPRLADDLAGVAFALGGSESTLPTAAAATDVLWRLVLDLGRPEVPWWELAARGAAFARAFGDADVMAKAAPLLRDLAVTARAVHGHEPPPADAAPERRIAECIVQLREQCGVQVMSPGACDPLLDPRGAASPAHQLIAFGDAAIPQLLAVCDDAAPTRSITCHRDFYFSHRPLTVGEVACLVFARITGEWVNSRVEAETVWAKRQGRDILDVWFDGTCAGNLQHADWLLAKDAARAQVALAVALAERPLGAHAALLERLSGIDDPAVTARLRQELREAATGEARVVAAIALGLRGEADTAVTGLITAWRCGDAQVSTPEVARVLLSTGSVTALHAVAEQPDRWERDWFEWLASGRRWSRSVCQPGAGGRRASWTPTPEPGHADARVAVLERFAAADASEPTGRVAQRVGWATEALRLWRGAGR